MILFVDNIDAVNYVENPVVFNLSSYYSNFPNLTELSTIINSIGYANQGIPINEFIYSPEFDIAYANLIISDNNLFIRLMHIMINVYEGKNVILLVTFDEYRDAIIEALSKLISVRYGYNNCYIIRAFEDLFGIKDRGFTTPGLYNFDCDKMRYVMLIATGGTDELIGEIPTNWNDDYEEVRAFMV